jgi:hypothetical protein
VKCIAVLLVLLGAACSSSGSTGQSSTSGASSRTTSTGVVPSSTTVAVAPEGFVLSAGWLLVPSAWVRRGNFSTGGSFVQAEWYDPSKHHVGIIVTFSACAACGRNQETLRPIDPYPGRGRILSAYRFRYDNDAPHPGVHEVTLFSASPNASFGYVTVSVHTDDTALADTILGFTRLPTAVDKRVTLGPTPPL